MKMLDLIRISSMMLISTGWIYNQKKLLARDFKLCYNIEATERSLPKRRSALNN
jgi:hypothetical protein